MSTTQPTNELIGDLVLVDASEDARDAARDRADARLVDELNEGGRFRKFTKSIWKGGVAKEYYRHKYIQQAHSEIKASQDTLIHEEQDARVRQAAMASTIERFQSEYDESIHTEAGEQREVLSNDSDLVIEVKSLIRDYAGGALDEENLQEEFSRVVAAYRESGGEDLKGRGSVQLSNMLEIARQTRQAVDHGESLDYVMNSFRVVSGEARAGVRTAAKYDKVERTIDRLHKTKVGSLIPHEALVAGVSIAASVARFGSEKAVYAAGATVTLGLASGVLGGLRERKRVKDERVQHSREMAQGKHFDTGSRRREAIEATRYESVDATVLSEELRVAMDEDTLNAGGTDALRAALDALARAETLVKLSDSRDIDLISYSDVTEVAQERFDLDIARAEAKVKMRQRLDDSARAALGLGDEDINELLEAQSSVFIDLIDDDLTEKDKAFVKLRRRRMAVAAAKGAVMGVAFGVISQEIGASLSDTRSGLVERLWHADNEPYTDGVMHNTVLNGLVEGDQGSTTIHHDPSNQFASHSIGKHGEIKLPDNYNLIDNNDGTVSIIDPNGEPSISSLPVDENGDLTKHARQMLRGHGMEIDNISKVASHTRMVDVHDYIDSKQDATTHVTRDLWYDNDTAGDFDKNELGMSWGGEDSTGINAKGEYSFNVSAMTADGSYHGMESTDWANQAEQGNLKLAVSATKDSQAHAFMLDIKPNGEVAIPKDSPASALFSTKNGHAVFNGAYAETVQVTGSEDGVTHMRPLATVVGENNPGKVPVVIETNHPAFKITPSGYETVVEYNNFTEVAPVIPVESRRALEVVRRRERSSYYGSYGSSVERARMYSELDQFGSPRLRDDPDADLELRQELDWYADQTRQSRGNAYVDSIEQSISSSPELSGMDQDIETIVTIPVKASGREESEGIYNQLRMFALQDPNAVAKNMMLLHVNWPISAESDFGTAVRIQKTKDEIDRARREFPNLKIATIESRWTDDDLQGGVIGHVADKMRDAALLSLRLAITEGRMASDHEVQIIRNDADARGIHKNYLSSFQKALSSDSEVDIFTGTTRFDEHRATDLPGMVLGQHFAQTVDIIESSRHDKIHTGGANFGVRASTLAAIAPVLHAQEHKGVGSDDVVVGRIIGAARRRGSYTETTSSRGRFGRLGRRPAYYAASSYSGSKSSRKVAKRITAAQIDTDSQRSEEVYLAGGYFHDTWDGAFDDGGHRERGLGLNDPKLVRRREELKSNPVEQVKLLEKDIQRTTGVAGGAGNPAIRTALEMMFAGLTRGGDYSTGIGYKIVAGRVQFTDDGKRFLLNRIARNGRGQFDQLGSRLARQVYGEVKAGSKRTRANAPLFSAT